MNPNTKGRVKLAWNILTTLRILCLVGALGAVFCIITIRKTTTSVAWIIRVGPGVALAHSFYAVYFLCRGINSRPAASCASYQIFAGLLDVGLVPFFAISCYMATMDYKYNQYGWGTVFNDNLLDYKVIQAFMILCGILGGFFAFSLLFDVYLAVTYRKITYLPPDLNPLEEQKDNLTARPRHKRNKSELLYEKHLSSSTVSTQRFSHMSQDSDQSRRIPFKHTRTDSADLDLKSLRGGITDQSSIPSRPSSAIMPAANARAAGAGLGHKPTRSSVLASPPRPNSWLSYTDYEGVPVEISDYAQHEFDQQVRPMSPVSAMSDNEPTSYRHLPVQQPHRESVSPPESTYPEDNHENHMPNSEHNLGLPPYTPLKKRSRDPLGMNPPTPVDRRLQDESLMVRPLSISSFSTPPRQAMRDVDTNSIAQYATPASRPSSFVGSGTKSRFYGDLRNSVGGSPTRLSAESLNEIYQTLDHDLHRNDSTKSAESGNFEVYGSDSDDEYDPYRAQSQAEPRMLHAPAVLVGDVTSTHDWNGQRQISNSTGYDLQTGYAGLDPDFGKGMARRREVSGKAAEEGRSYDITNHVDTRNDNRLGAAGWARFKGL